MFRDCVLYATRRGLRNVTHMEGGPPETIWQKSLLGRESTCLDARHYTINRRIKIVQDTSALLSQTANPH